MSTVTWCLRLQVNQESWNYSTVTDFVSELVREIPFLIFEYKITTHELYNSGYSKPLTKIQTKLHNEIMKLHNKGWGYTKIHRHLLKNGFEIGKSRTTVDSIIKKIKKREEFLSQPILDGIGNFRIKMLEII